MNVDESNTGMCPKCYRLFFASFLLLAFICTFMLWFFTLVTCDSVTHCFGDRPLPVITTFLSRWHLLTIFFPLPWVVAAIVLLRRPSVQLHEIITFATTLSSPFSLSLFSLQ
jgi:hypothetical protein